jgi:hypothetical protein
MTALHSGEVVIWSISGGLGTFVVAAFVHMLFRYLTGFTERYLLTIGLIFMMTILPAP